MSEQSDPFERVVVGGGCFWCLEAVFQRSAGVIEVRPGYAGGELDNPTYKEVCSGQSGHAEVVEILFEPHKCSSAELFELFFRAHDPTSIDRQGADIGTQYRSIICVLDESQRRTASSALDKAQIHYREPIVTQITALERFYPAEPEHHDYYNRHRVAPYCHFVIRPKLEKLGMVLE